MGAYLLSSQTGILTLVRTLLSLYLSPWLYNERVGGQSEIRNIAGAALVVQWFSAAFSPGPNPGDLGSSPMSGSLHGACFSLYRCLCLSLPLALCLS